jgi:hypothetical protein
MVLFLGILSFNCFNSYNPNNLKNKKIYIV